MIRRLGPVTAVLLAALTCACRTGPASAPPDGSRDPRPGDVTFAPVASGAWVHTSYKMLPDWGPFPANGLVIRARAGSLVIDAGYAPGDAARILDWAEAEVGPVRAVLVTHFHDDRTGGLPEVHRRGIPTFGLEETRRLGRTREEATPRHVLAPAQSLLRWGVKGEIWFPGAGHTADNLVVWLEKPRLLFGGCLIKAAGSRSLGNTGDADLDEWASTVRRLESRYPDVLTVVPGHGAPGSPDLLVHTEALAARASGRRRPAR